ncbi:hypothetical protein PMZ80_005722 [Knufia obscura]|uniref:Fe2OG dioxygenase domain-containing protein n=1 Tax=Knufia obscura TaxID=1635080 RepID=A0ABR0RME3_9EURO|nr:hypothetical protein PMZ80_005722 [Knufia obscura]
MAATAVAAPVPTAPPTDRIARRPTKILPQSLIEGSRITDKQTFDAAKHVNFTPPNKIYTMEEIGLTGQGLSSTAISEPFPLFTEEAIRQMRGEVFSQTILDKHQYQSSFASNMIRGHCPEDAPFIWDAWNDPHVLDIISKIAGIDLVPAWPFDTANINISVNTETDNVEITSTPQQDNGKPKEEEEMSAFGWHYDSVPFVCVTMLSDCTNMVGGETMIRTGRGEHMKMRGPTMGTAVIMQGRYIEHQALKAIGGGKERISMVTSLRPRSCLAKDEVVLTGVRGISYVPELYFQYAEYRLQALKERVRHQLRVLRRRHDARRDFDTLEARVWLEEQRGYIDAMLAELVEVEVE